MTTLEEIDDLLPQTQCRQCGCDGCLAYARAILEEGAAINRCAPGGAEGIARLAAATGRPVVPLDPEYARVTASVAPGASASVRPTPLQALPSTCTASWRSVARAARSACQPVPWTRSTWSKTEGRGRWRMRTGRESTIGMPQPAASASRPRTSPDSTHSESLRLKRPPAAPPRLSRTSWLEPAVQTPATTEED